MTGALSMLASSSKKPFIFSPTISANTTNYNLSTAATAAGWNGTDRLQATLTNNAYVGSTTTGAALTIPSLPTYSTVNIINNGVICGRGGNGGNGGVSGDASGKVGAVGGLALSVAYPITINNAAGIIGGGGGGGGGSAYDSVEPENGSGGGGGRGHTPGSGGTGGIAGQAATKLVAGAGGPGGFATFDAGDGGNLGAAGQAGSGASAGAGGNPGAAISGYSYITWAALGSIMGNTSG